MRIVLCTLLLLAQIVQAQAPPAPTTATVSGSVISGATGQPLKKATIVLQGSGPTNVFAGTTDSAGKYTIRDVTPGSYLISTTATGYLYASAGSTQAQPRGTQTALVAGQKFTADFKLSPQGVITGRVTSPDGEPLSYVVVTTMQTRFINGGKVLQPGPGSYQPTNDLGEFRISNLPPGRYLLSARMFHPFYIEQDGVDQSGNDQDQAFVPVFYPRSETPEGAIPVDVVSGRTTEGIRIELGKIATTRIRGRVLNESGQTGPISISINPADAFSAFVAVTTKPDAQGVYEFKGVAPGRYRLTAELRQNFQQPAYRGSTVVEAKKEPLQDADIRVTSGFLITGRVRFADGDSTAQPIPSLKDIKIALRPPGAFTAAQTPLPTGTADEAGNFALTHANPETFIVDQSLVPSGHYLKAARLGDVDVLDTVIDLARGLPGPLDIVLSAHPGKVTGVVKDSMGVPVSKATVVLVPDLVRRQSIAQWYRYLVSDASGQFTMADVPPGDYKVFAWADIAQQAWMDPDVRKPVESRAVRAAVKENGTESLDLVIIPVE